MPDVQLDEELLDTAFDVVRRYKSIDSYGSEAAAVRALQQRCSGISKEECRDAFQQSIRLFDVTTEVCAKHKNLLSETWQTPEAGEAASLVTSEIQQHCPEFSERLCRSVLSWIFYWYAL